MKYIAITLLSFYQLFLSPLLHQLLGLRAVCRFEETCSSYTRRVINQYGILYGLKLAIRRLLRCQPFGK